MKKFIIPTMTLAIGMTVIGLAHVSAATTPSTTSATTAAQIITKSDSAINTRIASLNKSIDHISTYKHLTAVQKTSLTATVQSSIDAMNALKAKIDGETDLTTLKTDYASITKAYRIYMVVLPSTATVAATDNAMANIDTYQSTIATLNTRITAAQTAGKDVTTAQAASADATVKLTDAQSQAQAVITAITSLKVDNGDASIKANNKAQDAAAITAKKAMSADMVTIRKDIASIRTALKK